MAWKLWKFNAGAKAVFTTIIMGKKKGFVNIGLVNLTILMQKREKMIFVVMGSVKDEKSAEDNFRMV